MNIATPIAEACPFNRSELKVVQLLANGALAKDAAYLMGVTIWTVNNYTQEAKMKVKAKTIGHLVAISLRQRWIE